MAIELRDKDRKYQRIRLNDREKQELLSYGLTPVLSSNVSAIAKSGRSLIVRFHGGATYEYPSSGNLYARMLNSGSKGKFVWNQLRRKNVPYKRITNIPMDYDQFIKGRDLMQEEDLLDIGNEILRQKDKVNLADTLKSSKTQLTRQQINETIVNEQVKLATDYVRRTAPQVVRQQVNPIQTLTTVTLARQVPDIIATLIIADSIKRERTRRKSVE